VLTPLFDPHFSTHSYGFRYGKRAHQAVRSVQAAAEAGYSYAVDCDLKSFFDTVKFDRLMKLLALRIPDKRVLRLIGAYLRAGVKLPEVAWKPRRRACRKAVRSRRCWPTSCWTRWTRTGEARPALCALCHDILILVKACGRPNGHAKHHSVCGNPAAVGGQSPEEPGGRSYQPAPSSAFK